MKCDNSLGSGVYYRQDDYAGFTRRLAVSVIDGLVLLLLAFALLVVIPIVAIMFEYFDDPTGIVLIAWLAAVWVYMVPLKRSWLRTVAYQILRIKIVDLRGQRPGIFAMTFRMLMWMFGPFGILTDLIWLGADTEGQSLRDCFAQTYVVRNSAEPIGEAPMHLTRYCASGMTLAYPRVCRPKSTDPNTN